MFEEIRACKFNFYGGYCIAWRGPEYVVRPILSYASDQETAKASQMAGFRKQYPASDGWERHQIELTKGFSVEVGVKIDAIDSSEVVGITYAGALPGGESNETVR